MSWSKEERRQYIKKYRQQNKEKIRQQSKEYRSRPENKVRQREYHRKYQRRPDVKQRRNQQNKNRYSNDPIYKNKVLQKSKEYMKNNREKINAYYRKYCKLHKNHIKIKREHNAPHHIKKLCLKYGFNEDIAEAIAFDGVVLDNKMKERGIIR